MLTFLRKIRKSLIDSSSTRKYLLYAVGEILLVMIGILLALQVNNWNEWRKERILEVNTLREIEESLSANIKSCTNASIMMIKDGGEIRTLLNHIEDQQPYSDSLEELFYYPIRMVMVEIDETAFGLLENRGIDIISNTDLRKQIVHFYGVTVSKQVQANRQITQNTMEFRNYYQNHIRQKMDEMFVIEYTGRTYHKSYPINYEGLLSNEVFKSKLNWRITRIELNANRLELRINEMKTLKKDIEEELQNL